MRTFLLLIVLPLVANATQGEQQPSPLCNLGTWANVADPGHRNESNDRTFQGSAEGTTLERVAAAISDLSLRGAGERLLALAWDEVNYIEVSDRTFFEPKLLEELQHLPSGETLTVRIYRTWEETKTHAKCGSGCSEEFEHFYEESEVYLSLTFTPSKGEIEVTVHREEAERAQLNWAEAVPGFLKTLSSPSNSTEAFLSS